MSPPEDPSRVTAEGARYALLRRLAPALRHEAVAPLQPIAMAASLLERRLRDPAPDLPLVQETATRLKDYSRAAVQSCLDLIEWLAPEAREGQPLPDTVRDTLDLLRGSLLFRGFTLRDDMAGSRDRVQPGGLRYVLPACLLWLTDSAGSPAEVTLRAQPVGPHVRLMLDLQPGEGSPGVQDPPAYRPLREDEVRALAHEEGIVIDRQGDTVSLTLARVA